MDKNIDTLLILGNGFYLHCGLDTSYKNFMNSINKNVSSVCRYTSREDNRRYIINYLIQFSMSINQINKNKDKYNTNDAFDVPYMISGLFRSDFSQVKNNNSNNYNFWQSYFNLLHNVESSISNDNKIKFDAPIYLKNWCDIESQMGIFFNNYSEFLDDYIKYYKDYYDVNNLWLNREKKIFVQKESMFSFHKKLHQKFVKDNRKRENHTNVFMVPLIILILRKCNFDPLVDDLYNYLFNQLYNFENKFKSFLQQHNNNDYALDVAGHKSHTKFTNLKNKTIKQLTEGKYYNLITFNYTNDKTEKCNNCVNVHSDIFNGHPIFGIDATNNFDKEYYRFTKTYRIMKLANNSNHHILDLTKDSNNKNIVFYGQSLASADYMYFEAIFNHFHIYSNIKIQLTFCYSSYINGKIDKNEGKHQFTRIYKLMNKYGNQCGHSDLLHKMLLEGRLCIKNLNGN